jgi:hypothetical protein
VEPAALADVQVQEAHGAATNRLLVEAGIPTSATTGCCSNQPTPRFMTAK